jgi:hypothetical protein
MVDTLLKQHLPPILGYTTISRVQNRYNLGVLNVLSCTFGSPTVPQNQQDSLVRLDSGPRGPQFKSGRPDHLSKALSTISGHLEKCKFVQVNSSRGQPPAYRPFPACHPTPPACRCSWSCEYRRAAGVLSEPRGESPSCAEG